MTSIFLALLLNYFLKLPVGFTGEFLFCVFIIMYAEFYLLSKVAYMSDSGFWGMAWVVPAIEAAMVLVILAVGVTMSTPLFSASRFSGCIEVVEHKEDELVESIPDLGMIDSVSLMDTASAKKLGDRTLGVLTDLVSQYKVGDYFTICVKGQVMKIAPLEYVGFLQWYDNRKIPGYVCVNPLTNEAKYVELRSSQGEPQGMRYSTSAFFGDNVGRRFRQDNKGAYFGDCSFQIDDEGVPYYVVTTMESNCWWGNRTPNGVGIMNAITGEIEWCSLSEVPEWVDLVYSGAEVSKLYNRHGNYISGFWNSALGKNKGITNVTDDYGYLTMGDDVYIYTGVTSVSSDESNLGVILVNTRTGVFDYYPVAGAEEYSAMSAAEGIVQNFGYEASFPSLITIDGEPTYVMVLKDSAGLVKQYACVNYRNYTIVVVEDSLDAAVASYRRRIGGTSGEEGDGGEVFVKKVVFVQVDGQMKTLLLTSRLEVYEKIFEYSDMLLEEMLSDLEGSNYNDVLEGMGFVLVENLRG